MEVPRSVLISDESFGGKKGSQEKQGEGKGRAGLFGEEDLWVSRGPEQRPGLAGRAGLHAGWREGQCQEERLPQQGRGALLVLTVAGGGKTRRALSRTDVWMCVLKGLLIRLEGRSGGL